MKRSILAITGTVLIILLACGCGKSPEKKPSPADSGNKTKIALIAADTASENYQVFKGAVTDKAKSDKLEIVWLDAQKNALKQEENLKTAAEQKAKVIIIEPVEAEMIKASLKEANNKGIKVICLGSLPSDIAVDAFVSNDYERAGEMLGYQLLDSINTGEKINDILILRGSKTNKTADDILSGNLKVLNGNSKIGQIKVEIIENWDPAAAYTKVREYLAGDKKPQAILAHSPELTVGMLKAVAEEKPETPILTFGIGTSNEAIEALKTGLHRAEVDLMPEMLAQIALQAAKDLSEDKPWSYEQQLINGSHNVPARFSPLRSITKENVDLLKERQKKLKAAQTNQQGSSGGDTAQGTSGGSESQDNKQDEKKTVVKIKTKDGQEFNMTIKGEIVSVEMTGEEAGGGSQGQ